MIASTPLTCLLASLAARTASVFDTPKLSSANTISNALSFEEQEITNTAQQEIDKEIAELERILEEKRKLKKKKDFEM